MHAIFCSTVKSTNSATAALSSVMLPLLVKFVVVMLVPFVDASASYNLRVESVMLFVVEFYVSVDDVSLVMAVLSSVVVLSEV
jgi:NADH:ubiquinone oxidoreductase subunit 4 (subunit M)